jgi:small subunit ribosomal protein S16
MSVKIRLSRTGKRNAPSYRIVAIDSRSPRDGRPLEILGHYNPSMTPPPRPKDGRVGASSSFSVKKDRIEYWQSVGAQTTKAVERLLKGEYEYEKYEPRKKSEEQKQEEN